MNTLIINNSGIFNQKMIHELFYKNNIADVKVITIIPEFIEGNFIKRAYLEIDAWHENETAYNFIQEMKTRRGALLSDEETNDFLIVKQTTIKIQQVSIKNKNTKYTQYFDNLSKKNVNAQICEYEAELEQMMQQEMLEKQNEISIPFNF